ncbi:C2H2 type zinc finger domain-containing protein [Apiospora kogelbergensis]|uniref:C2H2 type zinc finger domain-containing protein n=1 Tax=Apiospora kogelbergensis TaxID=1337665 RepID=A0AAW0R3W7_9PEZI
MTTTFDGPALAQDSEIYDPDEELFRNSPPMTALRPKFQPSPSPPPSIPLPRVSHPSNSGRKKSSNRRRKVPPSQGDAVLIQHMDGGKRPDIAFEAGSRPLLIGEGGEEEEEEEEESYSSSSATSSDIDIDDEHTHNLKSLAASALSAVHTAPAPGEPRDVVEEPTAMEMVPQETFSSRNGERTTSLRQQQQPPHPLPLRRETISHTPKPILAPPMSPSPYTPQTAQDMFSPRQPSISQVLRHPSDAKSPVTQLPTPSMHGDLPPIGSPQSEINGHASLPPIRSQLGEQLSDHPSMTEKEHAMRHNPPPTPSFPNSPPATSRIPIGSNPHASPPVSPNYAYSHSMPSPAHSLPMLSPYGFSPPGTGNRLRSGSEFSSINGDRPNISDQQIPTPASSITDRMSIDNMTNPQTGTFVCKFAGCNAAPFQTQYLLNSHANVHSSARPHYCVVKGCPRSEGGKGFKRKNEMIRHGLVHESPGYVCPFCPDREHKYPRPDNLQR